ncbi:MAG TPA: hypothetical protein VFQ53_28635 [Kofleriaceae bacterium]|nr:hypothetical protein [Kofleriaceae bacterium]
MKLVGRVLGGGLLAGILVACGGAASTPADPLRPNACLDTPALAFCNDFDRPTPDQSVAPFGFGEFLGGETSEVVVIGATGNRGLDVTSDGATFGQSGARAVGSATSATVSANLQLVAAAPGKSLTLGMLLLDGTNGDLGREVWVVTSADGTITVDALGVAMPTSGRIETATLTTVAIDVTWMPGAASLGLAVRAARPGEELAPILDDQTIALAPPASVSAAVAVISSDPGSRRFVFDNVSLDLQ